MTQPAVPSREPERPPQRRTRTGENSEPPSQPRTESIRRRERTAIPQNRVVPFDRHVRIGPQRHAEHPRIAIEFLERHERGRHAELRIEVLVAGEDGDIAEALAGY